MPMNSVQSTVCENEAAQRIVTALKALTPETVMLTLAEAIISGVRTGQYGTESLVRMMNLEPYRAEAIVALLAR